MFIDQFTKWMISSYLTLDQSIYITSYFNLVLAHNTGAAFSFLHDAGGWQHWFFGAMAIIISISFLIWLLYLPAHSNCTAIALSLVIAGALGNFIDRVLLGYVVDFIQLHAASWYWPAFNIADTAICVGGFLLVLYSGKSSKTVSAT